MNAHLLQCSLTPEQYQKITAEIVCPSPLHREYWQALPTYTTAHCPLCGFLYADQLDTYSLRFWVRPGQGDGLFFKCRFRSNDPQGRRYARLYGERAQEVCPHFVAVHHFVNLNGVIPTEVDVDLGCEVPYVIPVLLPDDIESYAVMHALPICRVEGGAFVPRYSLYIITYLSADSPEIIQRRWQIAPGWNFLIGPGYFHHVEKEAWDLARWVAAGKLQWLDPDEPDLPLRAGPVEDFPYARIEGRRVEWFQVRNGQVRVLP